MPDSFTIRTAEPADIDVIIGFIRELAEYEKLLHEVQLKKSVLREQLFGKRPFAHVLLAEWEDGSPVGFALYFYNFSTFMGRRGIYVEDVYVKPDYRGRQIGHRLFQTIAAQAVAEKCGRIEWQVLDWNKPALDFYEDMGARHKKEWYTYQLTGKALAALAAGTKAVKDVA